MSLYTIISEETPEIPRSLTQKEKDIYRFGGDRYSLRGPDYPQSIVMEIRGNFPFPKRDTEE